MFREKILSLLHVQFRFSPLSMSAIHSGWIVTSVLAGTIFTIKLVELLLLQGTYADPFLHYEAILPGHAISALGPYHCSVSETRINGQLDTSRFSCAIFPSDGFFDTIHVEGRYNQITELTFYANNISVGDLLLRWKPNTRPNLAPAAFSWNTGSFTIEVLGRDTRYERPVRILTIHPISPNPTYG